MTRLHPENPPSRVTQSTVTHRAQKLFVNKLERDQAHNKQQTTNSRQQLKMQLKNRNGKTIKSQEKYVLKA